MEQQATDRHGDGEGRVDRAHLAHQLRVAGHDWATIADRTGYRSPKVAAMAVNTYLQKGAVEQSTRNRRQALELELARLDRLQAAHFETAVAGDIAAASLVLRVIARRCLILGFDKPDEIPKPQRSIVIGGSSEEYIAGLQAMINRADSGA